jgi:hypothetical protein
LFPFVIAAPVIVLPAPLAMQRLLLVIITLALFLPNLFNTTLETSLLYNGKEKFDPALSGITSVNQLENYTDSIAATKKIAPGSYEYVALLDDILENRFYHGFSHFSLQENWIAAIAGKLVKEDYACKVQADEILKHENAACSQQALVMMQVLRDKNISYRSLGFPHHYAMEVDINNEWHFFDANMEPVITREQRRLADWKHNNDIVKQYYDVSKHSNVSYQFGNNKMAIVGTINEVPGRNASLFHTATGLLSKFLWLLPLMILLYRGAFSIEVPFVSVMMKRRRQVVSLQV